ncbi:MAG: GNAT family N-acetyltransferase [Spirochaetaceae bacterium]|jgi:GNAT superfamily N-acetyltransferase|nr:GNAT family N-acetyltransferase [Spirochaetaceae bacterium]
MWKKLRKFRLSDAEAFLREHESSCVSAISRLCAGIIDDVWAAIFPSDSLSALLLYGKRLLFPVFRFSAAKRANFLAGGIPLPFFFHQVLKNDPLHAAQGLVGDMDILEAALRKKGLFPASSYDYELRGLTHLAPESGAVSLSGLLIRKPEIADASALFPLQAGYEKEEVLPCGAQFDPTACRKGVEYLIAGGMVLTAELKGRLVGKVNINAQSYSCLQIGGVYVLPEYRSLGIAQAMTAALIRELAPLGKRFTLFVKKANAPARRLYDKLGFVKTGDYRISYYG